MLFGGLPSQHDAIITKVWIPIMTLGIVGGVVIGIVISAYV
jgi:hypothetical protein